MLDLSLVTFTARARAKNKNKKKYAPQERQSCWEYNENSNSVEGRCFHRYSSTDVNFIKKPKTT